VFDEGSVTRLLTCLLGLRICVIDDLSYQDVAPCDTLPGIKTLRQITNALVRSGRLTEEQGDNLLTVHSVSKTDCLAGARLAVAEIRDGRRREAFLHAQRAIVPNLGAILLTYLFYRAPVEQPRAYWRLRNRILRERSDALSEASAQLPAERNTFGITIVPPDGSLYPLMVVGHLPGGLSLDWLASGLARQGIGILPLATFARTEHGFENGRKTFRLTLGGSDGAEILRSKTRRVLIDLNRLIDQESSHYNRYYSDLHSLAVPSLDVTRRQAWLDVEAAVQEACVGLAQHPPSRFNEKDHSGQFVEEYSPARLGIFRQRFEDRSVIADQMVASSRGDRSALGAWLDREFMKDAVSRRFAAFRLRMYDRTVHPTQRYSLVVEQEVDEVIRRLIQGEVVEQKVMERIAEGLWNEYFGRNVAVSSSEESDELLLDLDAIIAAEHYRRLATGDQSQSLISFWSDWDGSNRPSGQGHRLVATSLMANVTRLSRLLQLVAATPAGASLDRTLVAETDHLQQKNAQFSRLLNDITRLTHQLERRYRGILPMFVKPGPIRKLGMTLRVARDPLTLLWRHNDRLERRMIYLRSQRRKSLEYYFSLNKRLRKQLHNLIPEILEQTGNAPLLIATASYADLLQRMVITPRIHQNIITAQDSFAVDTTVHNIYEINEIAGRYGNPGMILALQVSMSTKAEALVALDRKMRARHEETLRTYPGLALPVVRLIPLFEDVDAIELIPQYLQQVWDYAFQSRRIDQETRDRFAEIVAEVFIAGSDISQQVGQAAGAMQYKRAKLQTSRWLAEHGLVDHVRLKMGSGEPMQRQGGYYAPMSGQPAFLQTAETYGNLPSSLPEAARKSTTYATTPLMGMFARADLCTLQSTIAEQLRFLPAAELVQVLHHLRHAQQHHRADLSRAGDVLVESRMQQRSRGSQLLERLTIGTADPVYDKFLTLLTEDFRQVLYGREEDVLGIHIISYFIARSIPQLRDRPTVRPQRETAAGRGQEILGQIARMIPLSKRGSLLRAIAHNQAQTMVLGISQLSTGLFRALQRFSRLEFTEGHAETLIVDRLFPQLPVYEILQTLRFYDDRDLRWLGEIEPAFPAGNSAFLALREDRDGIARYLPLLQQELLRRHGLEVSAFSDEEGILPDLLPSLRPDLAVLLQRDPFNTDLEAMLAGVQTRVSNEWRKSVEAIIRIPLAIRSSREAIWTLLRDPIFERVQSFTELAIALHSLSTVNVAASASSKAIRFKVSDDLSHFFRAGAQNDDLRDFLASSVRYLSALSEGMLEVPVSIIRSLREVERIARIEEAPLSPKLQDLLRFHMLQIARIAGDNG
jgi:hypothetical protein